MARVITDFERCKSCGFCVFSCPKGAVAKSGGFNREGYEYVTVDAEKCICCGVCYAQRGDHADGGFRLSRRRIYH